MVSLLFDFLTLLFFLSEILYVFVHVMQLIQAVFVNCLSDQTRNFFLPIRNILFLVRTWWYVVGVYFLLVVFIALTIDGILYPNYYEKLIPQTRCFVFLEGWLILFWGDVSLIFRPFQICCCKSSSNLPYTWSYMHNLSDNVICAICLDTMDQNFVVLYPCYHTLHRTCYAQQHGTTCPLCRRNVSTWNHAANTTPSVADNWIVNRQYSSLFSECIKEFTLTGYDPLIPHVLRVAIFSSRIPSCLWPLLQTIEFSNPPTRCVSRGVWY